MVSAEQHALFEFVAQQPSVAALHGLVFVPTSDRDGGQRHAKVGDLTRQLSG
ncbi:MAG: hypothetical protein QM811_30330 [Pirellulales bacterium]